MISLHSTFIYYKQNFDFFSTPGINVRQESKKRQKGTKQKRTKKTTRKILMLNLNNGEKVPLKTIYMGDTKVFETDKVDIDKIRVSKKCP